MKKKKNILFIMFVSFVFLAGFSFAYYVNKIRIENNIETPIYGLSISKEYEMPSEFKPGDSVLFDFIATNESEIDVALRVIVIPHWRGYQKNGSTGLYYEVYYSNYVPAGEYYDYYTGETTSYEGYEVVGVNYSENNDWIYGGVDSETGGSIYYYKHRMAPKDHTTTLFNSLTFNSKAANMNCSNTYAVLNTGSNSYAFNKPIDVDYEPDPYTSYYDDEIGTVCTTGYNSAYNFVLHTFVETVQYDAYKDVWDTSVEIN